MLLSDKKICELEGIVVPFESSLIREIEKHTQFQEHSYRVDIPRRVLSYGLSSYGYDVRLSMTEFKIFRHIPGTVVNPKDFNPDNLELVKLHRDRDGEFLILPAHSYGLGVTVEKISMPTNVTATVANKSTYVRCGITMPFTVIEAGWEGHITLEFSNSSDADVRLYANEGIAQLLFFEGEPCEVSYSDRKIWFGDSSNMLRLTQARFDWAIGLYQQQREQFWIPEKVGVTADVTDYLQLFPAEQRVYNGILSYLTFLDSIQVAMLPKVWEVMTAPEVRHCLVEQCAFESIHNQSYQYLIDTVVPSDRRDEIHELWKTDKILSDRCNTIGKLYQRFTDTREEEDYLYALFADYLLEGIFFWNGFMVFYNFAHQQKMNATSNIIALIHRDENLHVRIFAKLLEEAFGTFPHSKDRLLEITDKAVKQEIRWTNHICNNEILGITESSVETFTKYLANLRLGAIGMPKIYEDVKSPYKHLERTANVSSEANVKGNFFETTITEYNTSDVLGGWDEF